MVQLLITSLADRPDLAAVYDDFPDSWPEFMFHDEISAHFFDVLIAGSPQLNMIAIDESEPTRPVARACGFPFTWAGDPDHELPAGGYDDVLLGGVADQLAGRSGNLVAALEVTVRPDARGSGLSGRMLAALRARVAQLGYPSLVVPVRPNLKHREPGVPIGSYARRTRADGLPTDPWLRVHVRAGGRIVGIAPRSMTVVDRLDAWRTWTGLPFDATGEVLVPQALVPVWCDLDRDLGVYVEPNVWVHHRLGDGAPG